jgi:hypothetical protein
VSAPLDGPPVFPTAPPVAAAPEPPAAWGALVRPEAPIVRERRLWATLGFGTISVVAAVFASFAPWAHYADGVWRSGIDHGDGWFVIAVAFVAAGLCGAVAAGLRHLAARAAIAGTGLVLFAIYGANRWSVGHATDQVTGTALRAGGGLYVVAFAALGLVIAALAMPSTPWWAPRAARAEVTSTSA